MKLDLKMKKNYINSRTGISMAKYRAIDFFCGGGGMTYGLRQAGIDVVAGVKQN